MKIRPKGRLLLGTTIIIKHFQAGNYDFLMYLTHRPPLRSNILTI